MTLRAEDLIAAIRYMLRLSEGEETVEVDDIDHLGNRRLRTIDELAGDELRKGFLKLRRTVQERMSLKDAAEMTPRTLINPTSGVSRPSARAASTASGPASRSATSTSPTTAGSARSRRRKAPTSA
jgi:DNA-directed RNA polymerase beta subunit